MKLFALALLLTTATATAQAQPVWRCGPDGRTYADSPCTGGRLVAVADPRSEDQARSAREVVARERELARAMAQERRENERHALAFSGISGIKAPAPQAVKPRVQRPKKKRKAGPEAGDIWPAIVHATRHKPG